MNMDAVPLSSETSPWVEIGLVGFNQGGLDADVLRGINTFRQQHPNWVIRDAGHQDFMLHQILRNPRLAGIIANVTDQKRLDLLQKWGKPVVDTSGTLPESPFPQIGVLPGSVGHTGGAFLLKQGYDRIVYVSGMQWTFEMDRWQGLREFCHTKGISAWWWLWSESRCVDSVCVEDVPAVLTEVGQSPHAFLDMFPKPYAVFAAMDRLGVQICEGCRSHNLRVPNDVGVLGVDNNLYFCESSTPPLSSVRLRGKEMGIQAAQTLQHLMEQKETKRFIRLEPGGVESRASTELHPQD